MTVPAPPTTPAPAPAPPAGLPRPQIPPAAAPMPPNQPTPLEIAPVAPTLAAGLPITPPNTITIPPIAHAEVTLTLEEQAAAQQAAAERVTLPTPAGSELMLPAGLGQGWEGKSVADLFAAHQAGQVKITALSAPAAPVAPTQIQAPAVPAVPPQVPQVPSAVPPQVATPAAPAVPPAPASDDPYAPFNAAVEAYGKVYMEQGNMLHQNQVEAFAKATNIPPPMVLRTLENEVARIQGEESQVYADLDPNRNPELGKQQYVQMITWMERNVAKEHQEQFDAALTSSDFPRIRTAVQTMYAAFQQSGGGQPQIIQGPPAGAPYGATPYRNWGEVTADMNFVDPKTGRRPYEDPNDSTFRATVESRLAVSSL